MAVAGLVFIVLVLAGKGWDPLAFSTVGPRFNQGDPNAVVGYDGQFSLYMVQDPLGAAIKMDAPVYRYQRILYPALAWLISGGGQPSLAPWALIFVNLAATIAMTGLLAYLLESEGSSGWYALLAPLSIGGLFTLRGNLNEHLSLAFALGGMILLLKDKPGWAAMSFASGCLAKELALLFAGAAVIWLLTNRRWRAALTVGAGSVGPLIVWSLVVSLWLNQSPFSTERTAFEWAPFYGIKFAFPYQTVAMLALWIVLPTLVLFAWAAKDLLKQRKDSSRGEAALWAWCLILNGLFIAFAPRASYIDLLAMMRLSLGLITAGLLWMAAAHRKRMVWLAALWGPSFLLAWMIPGFLMGT